MNKIILSLTLLICSQIFSISIEDKNLDEQLALEISTKDENNIKKIKKLLADGASPNVNIGNQKALAYCCQHSMFQFFELLISNGADINIKFNNEPILSYCCRKNLSKQVNSLLRRGVSLSHIDGLHIFAFCAKNKFWEIFETLVANGMNVNTIIDEHGSNVAMYYFRNFKGNAFNSNIPLDFLFEIGLDVNAVDKYGNNLFHQLLKNLENFIFLESYLSEYMFEIFNTLLYNGINIRKKNDFEETPISLAIDCEHKRIHEQDKLRIKKLFSDFDSFIRENKLLETNQMADYKKAGKMYRAKKNKKNQCCILQ